MTRCIQKLRLSPVTVQKGYCDVVVGIELALIALPVAAADQILEKVPPGKIPVPAAAVIDPVENVVPTLSPEINVFPFNSTREL